MIKLLKNYVIDVSDMIVSDIQIERNCLWNLWKSDLENMNANIRRIDDFCIINLTYFAYLEDTHTIRSYDILRISCFDIDVRKIISLPKVVGNTDQKILQYPKNEYFAREIIEFFDLVFDWIKNFEYEVIFDIDKSHSYSSRSITSTEINRDIALSSWLCRKIFGRRDW